MSGPAASAAAPSLKLFVLRSSAVALYRDFLRLCRQAPPESRPQLVAHVRGEFRSAAPRDEHDLKHLIRQGRDQLKQLHDTLSLSK